MMTGFPDHPINDLPASLPSMNGQRNTPFIIGMAGSDDGDGESFLAVFCHKSFFAGYFVSGVLPIRVGKGCTFSDPVMGKRLLVSRCRTYKDEL